MLKSIVPVYGASQSGKSTFIDFLMNASPEVDCYHVAEPFKAALKAFWGPCHLNDQEFRDSCKPTGDKTVRELMKSGFTHFRSWDKDCLLPRLKSTLHEFLMDDTVSVLLIDGIRNLNEAQCIEAYAGSLSDVNITPLNVVRVGVTEKDKQMQKALAGVTEFYDNRGAVTLYNGQDNLEAWEKTATYILEDVLGIRTTWEDWEDEYTDEKFEDYNDGELADIF